MPLIKHYKYRHDPPLWLLVLDQVNWYALRPFGLLATASSGGWRLSQWGLRIYRDRGKDTERLVFEKHPRRRVMTDERPIGRLGVLRFWLWFYLSPTLNRYRLTIRYYRMVSLVYQMRAAYYRRNARG